jgi:nucleoid-associated protein YgaU
VPAAGPAREPFAAPPRPATPPEPKRYSYLEEQYRWNAGDNFAGLSTKNYGTPKYADALLKYNQDYPLASREMRQTPPALAPGQVVWVPPVRILERDYANHIRDLTPITPATPTSRPAVEAVTPPPGLANSGFGNSAGQLYRVRAPGESVQEIARRTLGNSALAARVQGLNPTLSPDPRLPIPAGTVLRLPGDARVDATDKP